MGCICSKGASSNEHVENHVREKESKKTSKRFVASSRSDEVIVEVDNGGNDATARLISTEPTAENVVSTLTLWNEGKNKNAIVAEKPAKSQIKKSVTMDGMDCGGQPQMSRVLSISSESDGAQAGWPSWLTAVAGEAIKGWVPRKADSFEKLDKVY